jgi:hypothetical protein
MSSGWNMIILKTPSDISGQGIGGKLRSVVQFVAELFAGIRTILRGHIWGTYGEHSLTAR